MIKLEDLKPGMRVCGLVPDQVVRLESARGRGERYKADFKVRAVYEDEFGELRKQTIVRENEEGLFEAHVTWAIGDEAELGKLVWEARRIRDAHLFDPWYALHTSDIEPLPHQIVAVYEEMLSRQPLRFLLADDPGAGKTIMAGLLIRELIAREDVRRCLICVPGKLQDQWQRELREKFGLRFSIYAHEPYGNPFLDNHRLIVSIDRAKRDRARTLLQESSWDLVICDEAHKMSATYSGGDISYTARYRLGELLRDITRHFLLMTATPHNGKDADFRLFMRLLDRDRFEGRVDNSGNGRDSGDLYRRMMKEELRKFDGRLLFRERKAYTVDYSLSWIERELYEDVTEYIRTEFDRAGRLQGGRKNSVGFALTILQRRLASSPEAIYQSLRTRRRSLENRLNDWQDLVAELEQIQLDVDEVEDLSTGDREKKEDYASRLATAAETPQELQKEINTLCHLESQANEVRLSDNDHKWRKLREIWQVRLPEFESNDGRARKLIIFTEWRATIDYLVVKLGELLRDQSAIVTIHGGMDMDQRRAVESRFRDDPRTQILVANDAAGEGINLQCAHLMVNYDLPWNPNRLEQRFGRIHRIGQTEVCHLWNLVSGETREGAVYKRLLEKLVTEANALNGKVFDVLGELFEQTPLRDLMVSAIRYGDDPQRRLEVERVVDFATEQSHVRELVQGRMLVSENVDLSRLQTTMENREARRLQAADIRDFLLLTFRALPTGRIIASGDGFYRVGRVPGVIVQAAEQNGIHNLRTEYSLLCFDRALIREQSRSNNAQLVHTGHPLLEASINWVLQRWQRIRPECGDKLPVLMDNSVGPYETAGLRIVFYAEWTIQNAFQRGESDRQLLASEACFIELDSAGNIRAMEPTLFSGLRPVSTEGMSKIHPYLIDEWISDPEHDEVVEEFAIEQLVKPSRDVVEQREAQRINMERREVLKNLDSLITRERHQERYFEVRAEQIPANRSVYNASRAQHENSRFQFEERKMYRLRRWAQEAQISPSNITIRRAAVIVPAALLRD